MKVIIAVNMRMLLSFGISWRPDDRFVLRRESRSESFFDRSFRSLASANCESAQRLDGITRDVSRNEELRRSTRVEVEVSSTPMNFNSGELNPEHLVLVIFRSSD